MNHINWHHLIPENYRNLSFPLELDIVVKNGAKVKKGELIAHFTSRETQLDFRVYSNWDGYFYNRNRWGRVVQFVPEESITNGSIRNMYVPLAVNSVGVIYDTFEDLCNEEYCFEYTISFDNITSSHFIDIEKYVIKLPKRPGVKCVSDLFCSIQFLLKENTPKLVFTYPKTLNIKKGDKIYFLDTNGPYIDMDVIQRPYTEGKDSKAIVFNLLDDDINSLSVNSLEKIVVVHKDGSQNNVIDNDWRRDSSLEWYTQDVLESSCQTFRRYVNTFKKALGENGVVFGSKKQLEDINIGNTTCFVYLMYDCANGYYKIGISKTPKYREKTLQSEKPSIEMLCAKEFPSRKIAEAIEYALHKTYEEKRVRGEWFCLSEIDVVMIQRTLQ